jgi:hypothetical protein
MTDFLRNMFGKKQVPSLSKMPAEFPQYAEKAIKAITSSDGKLEDEELSTLFMEQEIPYKECIELILFLPSAFCRHMLPQVDWPDYYCEQLSSNNTLEIRYADNLRYQAIKTALSNFLKSNFTQKDFLKIAGRDAAFKSINQLLSAGGKIENVLVSPAVVIR